MTKRPRTRKQRLAIFFRLLEKHKPFTSFEEAARFMVILMSRIEKRFHGDSDLGMQAAALSEYSLYDSSGNIRYYEHKNHMIFISSSGAVQTYNFVEHLPVRFYYQEKPSFVKKDPIGNPVFEFETLAV